MKYLGYALLALGLSVAAGCASKFEGKTDPKTNSTQVAETRNSDSPVSDANQPVSDKKNNPILELAKPLIIMGVRQWLKSGDKDLTELKIYEVLERKLAESLNNSKRFTLLPKNICSISASPDREAIFAMSHHKYYRHVSLSRLNNLNKKSNSGFRLLVEAKVIGSSGDGEFVVADRSGSEAYVFSSDTYRKINLPRKIGVKKAFRVNGQWICQTYRSFYNEQGDVEANGLETLLKGGFLIKSPEGQVIIHSHDRDEEEENSITISIKELGGAKPKISEFPFILRRRPQGAVRLKDGRWLAIGRKLVILDRNFPPAPTETELTQALQAAEAGDKEAFLKQAERLTLYPSDKLEGLASLIGKLPDSMRELRSFAKTAQNTIINFDQWKKNLSSGKLPESVKNSAFELINQYQSDSKRFLEKINRLTRKQFSPDAIRRWLASGYQVFDGKLINDVNLVAQKDTTEALLFLKFLNPDSNDFQQGLFYLRDDGKLHQVVDKEGILALSSFSCQYAPGLLNQDLLFFPSFGLAALGDGKLTWLDRGERMKSMDQILGCDMNGRIYFTQKRFKTGVDKNETLYWVCNPKGKPETFQDLAHFPIDGDAELDSLGRLWFISQPRRTQRMRRRSYFHSSFSRSRETQTSRYEILRGAIPRPLRWKEGQDQHKSNEEDEAALYCYAGNVLAKCFTAQNLERADLLPGADGALFVISEDSDESSFVIEDGVVTRTKDLHALASQEFDWLMNLAPRSPNSSAPQEPSLRSSLSNPAILRTGDLLWINHNERLEAYRQGKPLLIQKRLVLLGGEFRNSQLLGTLDKKLLSVIIKKRSSSIKDVFWAIVGEKGIDLRKSTDPGSKWPSGTLCRPSKYSGTPLLDNRTGKIYYYHGFDRVWACLAPDEYLPLDKAGQPILSMLSGALLVYRGARTYHGYRIMLNNKYSDIQVTFLNPLKIVAEPRDGSFLCLSPEGPFFLESGPKGKYAIGESVALNPKYTLSEYLGKSDSGLVFTATDASRSKHVLLWSLK